MTGTQGPTTTPSRVDDFDYDLPTELIAQHPAPARDGSRLMVIDRRSGAIEDSRFSRLPDYLNPGDLLVANQSRVLPARVHGRLESGGAIELLLVRPQHAQEVRGEFWEVMARPAKKLRLGTTLILPEGVAAVVVGQGDSGRRLVRFEGSANFDRWLRTVGELPLPPYIKSYPDDPERYQTVYAREEGSIAAPTAGLHFTPELITDIQDRGIEVRWVTLHVGPGTFKTVQIEELNQIQLEPEQASISSETGAAISRAKREGRRVIAVGTTTTRTLEGLYRRNGYLEEWQGEVDLFISPPFEFKVVDSLITNFHLPRSTLLMLVSALAGTDLIREAYRHAIDERYRFYSFGDAMFIV